MGAKERLRFAYEWGLNIPHRRKGQGFIPRDLALLYRMKREGRVIRGRGTYGVPGFHTTILDETKLRIGNYSSVGSLCYLGGGHPPDRVTTYPIAVNLGLDSIGDDGFPAPSKDTIIGSDVYATHQTVVLSGCTIGGGAIVGIAGVVTKDVPAYAIVGGNPARLIRYRFSAEQIAALLEIRWWDWPEEEIKLAAPRPDEPRRQRLHRVRPEARARVGRPDGGSGEPRGEGLREAPRARDAHITRRLPDEVAADGIGRPGAYSSDGG